MKRIFSLVLLLASFGSLYLSAQTTGSISGKIIDGKLAEALIGVSVKLDDNGGAITDLDGNYVIRNVAPGVHKVSVNYPGYSTKTIEEIVVKANQVSVVDIALEEPKLETITEVVIVAKAQRESQSALTILQKTSPTIGDGISAETIRRTPDRTTGDVIRRVSGASIQDNKFAVIRGLNDRYNIALLNGALLSSTEPDRKAFSFDLFPSSMLDNLVVVKTASADLPGEFAGGAILVNTKDIPDESYVRVNLSGGYNTVSTFKPYQTAQGGGLDFLGTDDGTRALPGGFPSATEFQASGKDEKVRFSQMLTNDWAITQKSSAAPNSNMQIASGWVTAPNRKVQFGSTFAVSYSNQNRLQTGQRNDFDTQSQILAYEDQEFRNNVLWGSLLNTALKIGTRHKLILQGTYSSNATSSITDRTGREIEREQYVKYTFNEYTENHLLTSRLGGEHAFGANNIKLSWGGGFNQMNSEVPALRRMFYSKPFDAEADAPFRAFVPFGSADPFRSGRFYSSLSEDIINGNVDLTIPFAIAGAKQSFKAGGLYQKKDRGFSARNLGFIRGRIAGFNTALLELPQDQIFAPENINANAFLLDEITNPSDAYNANSALYSAYLMFDNKILEKLRISWGMRLEDFSQQMESFEYPGNTPINIDTKVTSWLPSANLTYSLNDKHQIRLSGSKTVSRPEFREIAPFAFFDNRLYAAVVGNPELIPTDVYNADLRYEIYPGQNELFSVSLFYKKFNNPIEFTFTSLGTGTRTFSYQNIPSAENIGVELEIRKTLAFVAPVLENVTVFANGTLTRSSLDLSNVSRFDSTRNLQGQSPYIINGGITYNHTNWGLSSTIVYNVIGDRVAQVGTEGYGDVYERHRHLLDFQISKTLWRRGELKLTWGDIFRPDFIYYQDNNANHKFDEGQGDNVMQRLNLGSTVTLGFGWKF